MRSGELRSFKFIIPKAVSKSRNKVASQVSIFTTACPVLLAFGEEIILLSIREVKGWQIKLIQPTEHSTVKHSPVIQVQQWGHHKSPQDYRVLPGSALCVCVGRVCRGTHSDVWVS